MPLTVNVHEAKSHFSRLLEQAHAGKPYARLMPPTPTTGQRRPGRLAGRLSDAFFEPLPEEDLAAWEDGACRSCSIPMPSSSGLPLVSRDPAFEDFGIQTLW